MTGLTASHRRLLIALVLVMRRLPEYFPPRRRKLSAQRAEDFTDINCLKKWILALNIATVPQAHQLFNTLGDSHRSQLYELLDQRRQRQTKQQHHQQHHAGSSPAPA